MNFMYYGNVRITKSKQNFILTFLFRKLEDRRQWNESGEQEPQMCSDCFLCRRSKSKINNTSDIQNSLRLSK